jgi:microcystin-dependent protein
MSEPFLGEIMIVGFPFAPRNWAACSGQIMPTNQNLALFQLLGANFGGNGQTTFALPNLNATIPVSVGPNEAGFNLPFSLGANGGVPSVTLGAAQLPAHTHTMNATDSAGTTPSCSNAYLAGLANAYGPADPRSAATLAPATVSTAGAGAAHDNRQPYLGMTFIIALAGIYPSKN